MKKTEKEAMDFESVEDVRNYFLFLASNHTDPNCARILGILQHILVTTHHLKIFSIIHDRISFDSPFFQFALSEEGKVWIKRIDELREQRKHLRRINSKMKAKSNEARA